MTQPGLSVTPNGSEGPIHGKNSELGLALAFQLGAFVLATVAITPFITSPGQLKPGISGVIVGLVAAWPVLAAGVAVGARRRGVTWRTFVGAMTIRTIDLGMIIVGVALQYSVGVAYYLVGTDDKKVSAPARELTDRTGGLGLTFLVLAVFLVVGAPVFEELFYRGLVLNSFLRAFRVEPDATGVTAGIAAAVASSAAWFGLIHFQLLQLPALAFVGMACAIARLKTGRIFTSICLHAGFNLATVVALGAQLARR